MKYTIVLNKVHRLLNKEGWPKKLVLEPKAFWDLLVAIQFNLDDVDWRFEDESEGFPYFILGPTMICPAQAGRGNELKLEGPLEQVLQNAPPILETRVELVEEREEEDERIESEETPERSVRAADRVDEGRVLSVPSTPSDVHDHDDVPDNGTEADPDGPGQG